MGKMPNLYNPHLFVVNFSFLARKDSLICSNLTRNCSFSKSLSIALIIRGFLDSGAFIAVVVLLLLGEAAPDELELAVVEEELLLEADDDEADSEEVGRFFGSIPPRRSFKMWTIVET